MKNKQIIGIVVAAVMFILVCGSSVIMNQFSSSYSKSFLEQLEAVDSQYDYSIDFPSKPFVGVVSVEGTIMEGSSSSLYSSSTYDHQETLNYIDALIEADNNKGILLYVNSPGGTVSDSDELYLKLLEYKEQTNRPVYTYMDDEACSGGYYISMASDYIMANRNAWTGSIGVIIQLNNLSGLYDNLGIKEINITSGANKAMGSSGTELTDEQKDILQSLVDESFDQFVDIIATGRGMTKEEVKNIADGRIYSAKQAKEVGLVDEVVKTYDDAVQVVKDKLDTSVTFYAPEVEEDTLSSIFGIISQVAGQRKSDVELVEEYLQKEGNGVPMYYAEP